MATKTTPVSARMNMNSPSIALPCSETSLGSQMSYHGATMKTATPSTGTARNSRLQKIPISRDRFELPPDGLSLATASYSLNKNELLTAEKQTRKSQLPT